MSGQVAIGAPLTLRAGGARVDLYPEHGGRIGQIRLGDRPLLRGPEDAWRGWVQWGSYPMLPWANRIPGGVAHFGAATITVPVNWPDGTAIHGLAGDRAWDVLAATEQQAEVTIEVALDRYHVRATQRFVLTAGDLDLEIELVNAADWVVPCGIGIHPWFRAAPVRIPADLIWPGAGPLPEGLPRPVRPDEDLRSMGVPQPMDRCFTGLTATSAEIGDLTLSWRGPITQIVVFSGEPGYVCVEPVTMANDGIRLADEGVAGTGVLALEPGASMTVGYRLSWADGAATSGRGG